MAKLDMSIAGMSERVPLDIPPPTEQSLPGANYGTTPVNVMDTTNDPKKIDWLQQAQKEGKIVGDGEDGLD